MLAAASASGSCRRPGPGTLLVGIDDTDNLESPGTGFVAQLLLESLTAAALGTPVAITRHQLLVDPRVPYTSHNSSACLALTPAPGVTPDAVAAHAATFLRETAAPGSDPGLCVTPWLTDEDAVAALAAVGRATKTELRTQEQAYAAAAACAAHLSGHGGTEDGVIGALAAVALHNSGADGFFLWLPGLRALKPGTFPLAALCRRVDFADARTVDGQRPEASEMIAVGPWVRPIWQGSAAVLLLRRHDSAQTRWQTAPKAEVKEY